MSRHPRIEHDVCCDVCRKFFKDGHGALVLWRGMQKDYCSLECAMSDLPKWLRWYKGALAEHGEQPEDRPE